VTQGIAPSDLITEARGSAASTGSNELASLERRVAFEVIAPAAAPAVVTLKIALVAPSARNDLAFTQSMVDSINLVAGERGGVQVDITDSTFVPAEAAAAIRKYAEGNYNLIIAHGVEFGTELVDIVKAHPNTVFAWGTATDTFGLPNLYAYDAAAEQGGYVEGAMAALLSKSGTVGVVGPIEVADAKRYVNGFKAGAVAQKASMKVPVTYTGSFGDIALAAEAANDHVAAGADVLTGTAEMVVGAVSVAHDKHVLWFGTQANQSSLAPDIVVASQVYHWEVILRVIVADIDAGVHNGRSIVANLADGGLVVEYNPAYPLPDGVKQAAEQLMANIRSGALVVPGP
jgi:basic membrane lipoprotein Med (substrate-binding protein (PBP1-ABC) superfamily)